MFNSASTIVRPHIRLSLLLEKLCFSRQKTRLNKAVTENPSGVTDGFLSICGTVGLTKAFALLLGLQNFWFCTHSFACLQTKCLQPKVCTHRTPRLTKPMHNNAVHRFCTQSNAAPVSAQDLGDYRCSLVQPPQGRSWLAYKSFAFVRRRCSCLADRRFASQAVQPEQKLRFCSGGFCSGS